MEQYELWKDYQTYSRERKDTVRRKAGPDMA
jgi:hypothetical protein